MEELKKAIWLSDTLKRLKSFPEEVKGEIGYSIHIIQAGKLPENAKHLKGFKPSVMEIVADYDTNTYRAIYTLKFGEAVYVLHCFQKKSNHGITPPKHVIDLIKQRLKDAENIHKLRGGKS